MTKLGGGRLSHSHDSLEAGSDTRGMSTGKVAACVGLGVGAVLVMQGGEDPLDPERSESSSWTESGLLGAPTRAVVCLVAVLLFTSWLYRLLFRPLELFRALEDVGYIAEDGRSRARHANEVRRRRKTGELPPVYPNGWYRVLSSHLLERGEVKNVTALGMISDGATTEVTSHTVIILCIVFK